jgi:hypothetical protein
MISIENEEYAYPEDIDSEDVALGYSIVKSNDEVSGVFMRDGKIIDIDYFDGVDIKNNDGTLYFSKGGEAQERFKGMGKHKVEIIEKISDEGAK